MKFNVDRWGIYLKTRRRLTVFVAICFITVLSLTLQNDHSRAIIECVLERGSTGNLAKLLPIGFPTGRLTCNGSKADDSAFTTSPCPVDPPGLGNSIPVPEALINSTADEAAEMLPSLLQHDTKEGGRWQPDHCQTEHNVALIIPYRDREDNLLTLLHYLHPMLQRQLIHYRIFVAEQEGNGTYNKGRIMNSAFKIVRSSFPIYDCFIFHDVDMVPEDDRNLYICADQPKHLSPAVNKLDYKLPYKELIGGALAMKGDVFKSINGYSNVYWGWGGEDDDMYNRITATGYEIVRPPLHIGRYSMLKHVSRTWISHSKTYELLGRWKYRHKKDGLNNVKFNVISIKSMNLYTHILIRLSN